jgi:hypothetical protein
MKELIELPTAGAHRQGFRSDIMECDDTGYQSIPLSRQQCRRGKVDMSYAFHHTHLLQVGTINKNIQESKN